MALQKIVIDGQALRAAIRDAGGTIKGTAEGARIGEKTLHKILKGLPIRSDKVELVFKYLNLNIDEFRVTKSEGRNPIGTAEDNTFIFTGDSEITLGPLEVPDFRNFPIKLIYRLDVPAASKKQLEAMKAFNNVLEFHFASEPSNRVDFETEYNKLSLYTEVNEQLERLKIEGLFVRFGTFVYWRREQTTEFYADDILPGLDYTSTTMMAVLISDRIKSGTALAKVNKGHFPESLHFAHPDFHWTKINGEFLPHRPEGLDDDIPF